MWNSSSQNATKIHQPQTTLQWVMAEILRETPGSTAVTMEIQSQDRMKLYASPTENGVLRPCQNAVWYFCPSLFPPLIFQKLTKFSSQGL